ncbi:MAG: Hpt domain-containing protein [Clostridiales bacterium]|nr:Hpt domain-containing protein [Clostridiales bacterium]
MSNDILRQLEYVGVDTDAALTRLVRNERLYKKILYGFLSDTNFKELEKSIAKRDYKNALFSAHTLKGISGNLGMEPLFGKLEELVKKMYDNDFGDVDQLFLQISAIYHSIYTVIEKI